VPAGAFPIAVADRMSITGNTTDSPLDYHYYFYRWVVESPCAALSDLAEGRMAGFNVVPNPISDRFQWVGQAAPTTFTWLDMAGREVARHHEGAPGWLSRPSLQAGQYILVAHTEEGAHRMLVQLD